MIPAVECSHYQRFLVTGGKSDQWSFTSNFFTGWKKMFCASGSLSDEKLPTEEMWDPSERFSSLRSSHDWRRVVGTQESCRFFIYLFLNPPGELSHRFKQGSFLFSYKISRQRQCLSEICMCSSLSLGIPWLCLSYLYSPRMPYLCNFMMTVLSTLWDLTQGGTRLASSAWSNLTKGLPSFEADFDSVVIF